jgi:hypothetical protein
MNAWHRPSFSMVSVFALDDLTINMHLSSASDHWLPFGLPTAGLLEADGQLRDDGGAASPKRWKHA